MSNWIASQPINWIPSVLIEGYVSPYATINPLPSYPIYFSLNQSGINVSELIGAKFDVSEEDEDEEQSKNMFECKLHRVYDFSLWMITPPDSSTYIELPNPDFVDSHSFITQTSNIIDGRERFIIWWEISLLLFPLYYNF
jgi:hypothetical protein